MSHLLETKKEEDVAPRVFEYIRWQREDDSLRISSHFSSTEFTCRCGECNSQRISLELVWMLEDLRRRHGHPIQVLSGFRCNARQRKLKEMGFQTAKNVSQHELGNAVDITTTDMSSFIGLLEHTPFDGIGYADNWVHLHLHPFREKTRWTYPGCALPNFEKSFIS